MSAVDFGSKLLTQKEVAEALSVSERTLEGWRWLGRGPKFVRISGRAVRYRPSAVEEFVARREVSSTSDPGSAS